MVRRNGALGFINKTSCAQSIVAAVRAVLEGDTAFAEPAGTCGDRGEDNIQIVQAIESLTPQQRTVLRMLGEGLLNKQIAYELSISESTVKGHVSAILRKFEVPSRMQAVLMAQRTMLDQNLGGNGLSSRDVSMSR
jgi:DNA-binding NarL/FixJ family response regulator